MGNVVHGEFSHRTCLVGYKDYTIMDTSNIPVRLKTTINVMFLQLWSTQHNLLNCTENSVKFCFLLYDYDFQQSIIFTFTVFSWDQFYTATDDTDDDDDAAIMGHLRKIGTKLKIKERRKGFGPACLSLFDPEPRNFFTTRRTPVICFRLTH